MTCAAAAPPMNAWSWILLPTMTSVTAVVWSMNGKFTQLAPWFVLKALVWIELSPLPLTSISLVPFGTWKLLELRFPPPWTS